VRTLFPYFEKRVTELAKSEKTVDGITTKIDGEFGESYLDFYDDYVEWVVEKLVYEGKIEQPQPTCAACNKLINGKIEWYCNYNMNLKIMCHDCYEARMDAERRLSEMPPALGIGNIMDKLGVSDKVAVAARNKVIMSGKWGDPDQLIAIIRGSNRARHAQAAAN
jgi:hypothetical protein